MRYSQMISPVYIGTYNVVKVFFKSARRQVLERGLTREEALRIVNTFPDSTRHMVICCKQYSADKYYKEGATQAV